jgi:hypothetical protein
MLVSACWTKQWQYYSCDKNTQIYNSTYGILAQTAKLMEVINKAGLFSVLGCTYLFTTVPSIVEQFSAGSSCNKQLSLELLTGERFECCNLQ